MKRYYIIVILTLFLLNCNRSSQKVNVNFNNNQVDSISINVFTKNKKLNYYVLDLDTIHPKSIGWAQNPNDIYVEGFYINNKELKIYQPNKIDTIEDSKLKNRLYLYDNEKIKTIRVITDSLNFNFNNIVINYDDSNEIFKKGNFIILINEPAGWCGTANQYRFVQIFDLRKFICYELFINFYATRDNGSR